MLDKIGTEKRMICFDGKEHLCRVEDFAVIVSGNTFPIRKILNFKYNLHWDSVDKTWSGIIQTADDLRILFNDLPKDVKLQAKSNYRIIDAKDNPIENPTL